MKQTTAIHAVVVMLCAVAAAGCTSRPPRTATIPAAPHVPTALSYSIAQLGFGNAAHYGLCLPPACPSVTPKNAAMAGKPEQEASPEKPEHSTVAEGETRPAGKSLINLLTIHFRPGQATLDASARRAIDAFVTSTSAGRIQVAAHTDSTGSHARNVQVVQQRAEVVTHYLKSIPALAGVPVESDATPLCCYVAPNDDPAGRRLNRRVDILLTEQHLGAL